MSPYYDSQTCRVEILSNTIKLQSKKANGPITEAVFSLDQLRETARFGANHMEKVLNQHPDQKMINAIEKYWSLWKKLPDHTDKSEFDFGKDITAIKTAFEKREKCEGLNVPKSYINQLIKSRAQRQFEKEWRDFIIQLIFPSQATMADFLERTTWREVRSTYTWDEIPLGEELLGQFIRLIVDKQVENFSLATSKELPASTIDSQQSPVSWTALSGAYAASKFERPITWLMIDDMPTELSRVVNFLAMVEHHLDSEVMEELANQKWILLKTINFEETFEPEDETFGHAVELLQSIAKSFVFIPPSQ